MVELLHTHLNIQIEVLSPVHVGDGQELLRDIDYVVHGGRTYVVHQEKLLEQFLSDDDKFDDKLLGQPISQLLQHHDYENPELFRYILPGKPKNRPIRSHVKTVYNQPYIPGSTIKGLLRTMYIWGRLTAKRQAPDVDRLSRSRSWAAQPIERDIMGRNPNEDVFRAIHISDSEIVSDNPLQHLAVHSVNIYPTGQGRQRGVVVDVEALKPYTVLEARMSIEEYGFTNVQAQQRLGHWKSHRKRIERIAQYGQAFAGIRLADEWEYLQGREGAGVLRSFYKELIDIHNGLGANQFLAQIGWGAGWSSKTLNDLLTTDKKVFARLVHNYRLTRNARNFKPGTLFPKSRHVVEQNARPVRPMGWVKVTIS